MSETVMQASVALIRGDTQSTDGRKVRASAAEATAADQAPPVGYRWISKRWRVLPDGTRDYAVFHGKTAFSSLLPVGSKARTPNR